MYMGAALLVVGAIFVFVRGQHQVMPAEEDAIDRGLGGVERDGPGGSVTSARR